MFFAAAFIIELFFLFFLSRSLTKSLSGFLSIQVLSFLFLPGIIIHELSHLFVAMILFVPVGEMEFIPKKHDGSVKLGSVEIAKTDPIRRSLIGFAPFFAGLMLILGMVYLFSLNLSFFKNQSPYVFISVILVFTYLLFAVSNTMFSSSKDMEGAVEILVTLLILFAGAYILGFRPTLSIFDKILTKELLGIIQRSTIFLLVPIFVDVFILGMIRLFNYSRSRIS